MSHVIVSPPVSRALGPLVHNRTALVRILTRLRDELENRAARFQKNRDPNDTDCFIYHHSLYVGSRWYTFRFAVNDVQAQGYLFVQSVSRRP